MKHEIARSPSSHSRKTWLLGSVSALAIGVIVLGPAWADGSPYPGFPITASNPESGVVAAGYTTLLADPSNLSAMLSATITNGLGGIEGAGSSAVTTANNFTASAGGNDVTNSSIDPTLPLPEVAPTGKLGLDGVAVLGNSTNGNVVATALVANSSMAQQLAASVSAATVSSNTIAANVTLNQSTTTVQGQVPLNYAADTTNYVGASSSVNQGAPYDATASVLATTAQFNGGSGQLAGSNAMVTESTIGQTVTGATNTADVLNGSPAVTGNNLTANFAGNSATTGLTISAGGAPAFNGSTALTNVQENAADSGAGSNPASIVKYSYIQFELNPGTGTVGEDGPPASVTLNGALAMTGNMITATATGNQAEGASLSGPTGNVLTLAGGIGLQGTSENEGETIQAAFFDGVPGIGVNGDAVVNNVQTNDLTPLNAMVKQSSVLALLPSVAGGTVAASSNAITAQTVGNEAYNALLAPGLGSPGTGAPLNGLLAVGNLQSNQGSALTATLFGPAGVAIAAGGVNNATLTLDANTVSASATGNSVINAINLNASSLPSYSGFQADTLVERNLSGPFSSNVLASGDATLTSLQANDASSPVVAVNQNGGVSLDTGFSGGSVTGSALSVTGNTTAALATGNAANNTLTLNGASIAASGALLGVQSSFGAVTATLTDPTAAIVTGGGEDPSHSTLELTGNLERAIASGNFASNTLSVTGSSIAIASNGGPAAVFNYTPSLTFPIASDGQGDDQVYAGYIAHNDQATTAPVTAAVTFAGASNILPFVAGSMVISIGDTLTASTADNSMNAIVAAARGNQATTQLTLSPSASLSVAGDKEASYSPFAVVANAQTVGNATNVLASITSDADVEEGPAPPPVYTTVTGGMTGSTLTMTANQITALAQGNNATNGLTLANAGTVTQPSGSHPLGLLVPPLAGKVPSTTLTADSAFTVQNMQVAGTGAVTARQNSTGVQADITGDLSGSTVTIGGSTAALGNAISSTATTNLASNVLTLGASNLSASSGLENFQVSNGATSTTMGSPGTPATPGSSHTVIAFTTNMVNGAFVIDNSNGEALNTQLYTGWLVSTDPESTLDGFVQGTGLFTADYYKDGSFTFTQANPVGNNTQTSFPNIIPPTPGTLASPGLVITLNGNVTNSTLGVMQNTVNAASTANAATNTVTSASAISSSSLSYDYSKAEVPPPFTGPGAYLNPTNGAIVQADLGLLNNQTLGAGGSVTATANGSFGISNAAVTPVYTNATLSVSDNTQLASASGNTATNSQTLSPGVTSTVTKGELTTSLPPLTASILSVQTANGGVETPVAVSASSNMLIGAPLAMSNSTLTISGNTNTASAVVNDVTNALTVTGTSSLPGTGLAQNGLAQASLTTPSIQAFGDYTVVNSQVVGSGSVQTTATTAMGNNDLDLQPGAISNTSVSVDSNTTVAQSLGNRASNMLTITAAGPSGATGAVANGQINAASIGAAATINTTLALGQAPQTESAATSTNATYGITNNTTQALATGNQASNSLNASPAAYGATTVVQSGSGAGAGTVQTAATYAVLNAQYNTGPVTATVNGASPVLLPNVINGGGGGYVMALNTTGTGNVVNVSGNTVTSQAIGNRANNNIVLAALNTGGASSSINSVQQNTGAISASISNVQVGAAVSAGTTARVGGNSLAASAFGNIVTSSIVAH